MIKKEIFIDYHSYNRGVNKEGLGGLDFSIPEISTGS